MSKKRQVLALLDDHHVDLDDVHSHHDSLLASLHSHRIWHQRLQWIISMLMLDRTRTFKRQQFSIKLFQHSHHLCSIRCVCNQNMWLLLLTLPFQLFYHLTGENIQSVFLVEILIWPNQVYLTRGGHVYMTRQSRIWEIERPVDSYLIFVTDTTDMSV